MAVYNSFDELVGKTPLVRLLQIEKALGLSAKLYAKLEYFNPAGSVKDRAAMSMLNDAEKRGIINKDTEIIEPTSGNTGIGLLAVAASRGYPVTIVMPENMSEERKLLMKAYGAKLVLTPASLGMTGAIREAERLARENKNSFIPAQFENPANAAAHYETTGPEIYGDLDGDVSCFVAGVGTGGTITGTGRFLKEKNSNVKIIAVEPKDSAVLSGGKAGAHGLQGIGAGFIPTVLDTKIYDEVISVTTDEAYEAARLLAKREGYLVGISSGAALSAALSLAKREEYREKNIVTLLADGGDRYLSTKLFSE